MKTNTIQNAIREIGYSKMNTMMDLSTGKTYEFFKLDSDGYIYVLCTETNRATRYNGEGQNGKRISMDAYLEAVEILEHEAAIKEVGETETTEEVKEIVKELAPKAKKTRRPKDVAFKTIIELADDKIADVTLTAKQVDFIQHLPDTYFWEDGLESVIWVDCLCDDIQGQFAGKPMTVGAMISTLCEKDLGQRATDSKGPRGGKATSFCLTELGKRVAAELGLR